MLKPGGRLLLREHNAPTNNIERKEFSKVIDILHDIYDYVLDSEMSWDTDKYYSKYRSINEWDDLFKSNGFTPGKLNFNSNKLYNPQNKYERVYFKNTNNRQPILGGVNIRESYINPNITPNKTSSFELI